MAGRTWQRSLLLGERGGYHVWVGGTGAEIDFRWAHQLPRKPGDGVGASLQAVTDEAAVIGRIG